MKNSNPKSSNKSASCLIGAGYSYVAGLPLARDLLSSDVAIVSRRAKKQYQSVWKDYGDWLEENPDGFPEEYLAILYEGKRDWPAPPFSLAVGLIAAVLATPSGRDIKSTSPRYSVRITQPSHCISHIHFWKTMLEIFDHISALTTNYDLLIERALRHRPMKRGFGPGCYYAGIGRPQILKGTALPFSIYSPLRLVELHGDVPIFKLHGSLNWSNKAGQLELFQDMRPAFRRGGDAAIVPPISEKIIPEWLSPVWEEAEQALYASETWIVCGYSMPKYDLAIQEMLARASDGALKRIILINPNSLELREHYAGVAPNAEILFLSGLPHGIHEIKEIF